VLSCRRRAGERVGLEERGRKGGEWVGEEGEGEWVGERGKNIRMEEGLGGEWRVKGKESGLRKGGGRFEKRGRPKEGEWVEGRKGGGGGRKRRLLVSYFAKLPMATYERT
jgi:hypothetical protein